MLWRRWEEQRLPEPAATSGCGKSRQRQQAVQAYVRGSAMPPCRRGLPTVLPSARAKRGQLRQRALPLLRAVQRLAIVQVRAGCGFFQGCRQRVREGLAARAGLASLACVAASCPRAGRGCPRCYHQRVWRFCSTGRHYFSYERCGAMPSRRERATGGSLPAYLLGTAGSPGGIRRLRAGSPIAAVARASVAVRWLVPVVRCTARTSRRRGSPTALPSARGRVPPAPAVLTSLACVAAPCHRAGCGHLRCRRRRVQKGPRH